MPLTVDEASGTAPGTDLSLLSSLMLSETVETPSEPMPFPQVGSRQTTPQQLSSTKPPENPTSVRGVVQPGVLRWRKPVPVRNMVPESEPVITESAPQLATQSAVAETIFLRSESGEHGRRGAGRLPSNDQRL